MQDTTCIVHGTLLFSLSVFMFCFRWRKDCEWDSSVVISCELGKTNFE